MPHAPHCPAADRSCNRSVGDGSEIPKIVRFFRLGAGRRCRTHAGAASGQHIFPRAVVVKSGAGTVVCPGCLCAASWGTMRGDLRGETWSMTEILVVDIGNSQAKFGLFEKKGDRVEPLRITSVSLHETQDTAARLKEWSRDLHPASCLVAGPNPPVVDHLQSGWPADLPDPRVIRQVTALPVRLCVDRPQAVGIDRALNALAVGRLFPGRCAVVADSGTATKVDLVSASGDFLGGTIFCGLRLSAHALHDYTARLPLIDVDSDGVQPELPGRSTEQAMRAGLYWGQVGAIREISDRLKSVCPEPPVLILTGGAMEQLRPHFPDAVCIDSLPLHGLAML